MRGRLLREPDGGQRVYPMPSRRSGAHTRIRQLLNVQPRLRLYALRGLCVRGMRIRDVFPDRRIQRVYRLCPGHILEQERVGRVLPMSIRYYLFG